MFGFGETEGKPFKFNFDANVFIGLEEGIKKVNSQVDITSKRLEEVKNLILAEGLTFEKLHTLLRERKSLEEQLKLPIEEVNELLEIRLGIAQELVASSEVFLRASGTINNVSGAQAGTKGGLANAGGRIFGGAASKTMIKDAGKVGETIFDGWANVLTSNMNTAWAEIFGEANSLFEQLINSMADLLVKSVFTGLLSFLPGGGIISGIAGLFGGGAAPSGGPTTIIVELGGRPLGEMVLDGNKQIQQLRLV